MASESSALRVRSLSNTGSKRNSHAPCIALADSGVRDTVSPATSVVLGDAP